MRIIGITGRKRHGKNTVASLIVDRILRHDPDLLVDEGSFAAGVRETCSVMFPRLNFYDDAQKEIGDPRVYDGLTPRRALQYVATEVARTLYSDVWVERLFDCAEGGLPGLDVLVITDVRFLNEAEAIKVRGGQIWRVVRPDLMRRVEDTHASEVEQERIIADVTIVNDGSVDDLAAKVREALRV